MFKLPIFLVLGNINCTTDSECPDGMVCYKKLCTGRKFHPQLSVFSSFTHAFYLVHCVMFSSNLILAPKFDSMRLLQLQLCLPLH